MLCSIIRAVAVIAITSTLLAIPMHAQTDPQPAVNYQAVARNADGSPIAGREIGIRFRITDDTVSLRSIYTETHRVSTDDLGTFTVLLGRGSTNDDFKVVQWGTQPYWLVVYLDPDASGPTNELLMGLQEVVSVPLAIRAEFARRADTALTTRGFYIGRGVTYGDGDSLRYLPAGPVGSVLTSTGTDSPAWRSIEDVITDVVIDSVGIRLLRDTVFLKGVSDDVRERLVNDSTFIRDIISDPELRAYLLRYIDSVLANRPVYATIRDSLLRDPTFLVGLGTDSTIQRALADDAHFVERLFANARFMELMRAAVDEMLLGLEGRYWKRRGDTGTDAGRDFIGTLDGQGLAVRTNNVERLRISAQGDVGINTSTPTATLDINGSLNVRNELRASGAAGSAGNVLTSGGAGAPAVWTSVLTNITLSNPVITAATFTGNTVFNGPTTFMQLPSLPLANAAMFVGSPSNTASVLAPGNDGQVLTMQGGRPTWQAISLPIAARNGLTVNAGNVEFGGTLLRTTTVDLGANDLVFASSTGNVGIGPIVGAPQARLHVAGSLRIDGPLRSNGSSGAVGEILVSQGTGAAPSWTSVLSGVTMIGTTLLGTTTVAGPLSITGPVGMSGLPEVSSTKVIAMQGTALGTSNIVGGQGVTVTPSVGSITIATSNASAIRTVTGSAVATPSDYCIIVNNNAAASVLLPSAASNPGRNYLIKRSAASTQPVIITTGSGETIDGLATYRINTPNGRIILISDGINWLVIDAY